MFLFFCALCEYQGHTNDHNCKTGHGELKQCFTRSYTYSVISALLNPCSFVLRPECKTGWDWNFHYNHCNSYGYYWINVMTYITFWRKTKHWALNTEHSRFSIVSNEHETKWPMDSQMNKIKSNCTFLLWKTWSDYRSKIVCEQFSQFLKIKKIHKF